MARSAPRLICSTKLRAGASITNIRKTLSRRYVSGATRPWSPASCGERVARVGNPLSGRCGTATPTCEEQRDGDTFLVKPRFPCPRQRRPPRDEDSETIKLEAWKPISGNKL